MVLTATLGHDTPPPLLGYDLEAWEGTHFWGLCSDFGHMASSHLI